VFWKQGGGTQIVVYLLILLRKFLFSVFFIHANKGAQHLDATFPKVLFFFVFYAEALLRS